MVAWCYYSKERTVITSVLNEEVLRKRRVFGGFPNLCCPERWSGWNRMSHPDWVKFFVDPNGRIKLHANQYEILSATDLKNKFYVDNLLVTSENTSELVNISESAVSIMAEGNFCLRSCTSNYAPLRDQMKHDGSFVEHDGSDERLLCYKYRILRDSLKLNPRLSEPEANTKRKILAQTSAVFDLLSLCLPVTMKERLFTLARFMEVEVRMGWCHFRRFM